MRWLILVLALLVALVVAIFIMGGMLPASHVALRSTLIHQPPEVVWRVITDHANEPKWRSGVKSVKRLADRNGHPVWQETDQHNNKLAFETLEAVPPKKLVRQIVADENAAFAGRWDIELEPAPGGTKVTITENGEVQNHFFRFISRFIIGHTATMETYLRELSAK